MSIIGKTNTSMEPMHATPIRSRSHPLVQRLRALKQGARQEGLALIEGVKLLEEALAAGVQLAELAVTPRAAGQPRVARALEQAAARGAVARTLDEAVLFALSEVETSQGVLALARRPTFVEDALYAGTPLIVVAAGIQNPGNLGGLLRTAEAAGATGAYLCAGCADAFSWKTLRGSMGSAFRLPQVAGLALEPVLDRLRERGVAIVAAASSGEAYDAVDMTGSVALLFGSEGAGLPPASLARAARRAAIPMAGAVESLNVGVAAGVLLFEAARQRRTRHG
jgi:TrmH family RNA methyltransferase